MTVPSKWEIAQHWACSPDREVFAPRMYDLGEPCCFACGWYSERWDKATARTSWQRATLDRAHIVPASLGGSDEASNLLLLCSPCHQESPDWPDPQEMARWVASRPSRRSKEFEGLEAWIQAAAEVPEFVQLLSAAKPGQETVDRMKRLLWEATQQAGMHWSVGLSQGTRVAIVRRAVELAGAMS
ncbi:HNH endonuclease [Streptomyces platensis]|uniref:HNH endonuclease n=1 Tax=Streptomyces platensis TaxID=58346 RepID=UPI002E0FB2C3|nr:HNH endonuclease [Streptomyces platensis]